ncbi:MAG TPA: DUF1983 domain-containing protein [Nocardioides sp.]|nr:DUF1983 domain-containing protein [Nocardioides sp.]
MEWDAPIYTEGHGHFATRIYGAVRLIGETEPTFGDPRTKLIDTAVGPITFHAYATGPSKTWHLWIKWVTVDGVESTNPAGGTHGVVATTGVDIPAVLQALSQQIRMGQLYADLSRPITRLAHDIDEAARRALEAALTVHEEGLRRAEALLNEARDRGTALQEVRNVINQGDTQLAEQIVTLTAALQTGNATLLALVQQETAARVSGDQAEALARETLAAEVQNPTTGLAATRSLLLTDYSTTASMTAAIATASTLLTTAFTTADDTTLSTAQAYTQTWAYSRSDVDGALNTLSTNLTAAYQAADAGVISASEAYVQSYTYTKAHTDAIASNVTTLFAKVDTPTVGNNPTYAALQTEATVRAGETGHISSKYTVRTELTADGRTVVGGFGITGTSGGTAGPTIDFGVLADRFWIGAPTGSGDIDDILPFFVQTTNTTLNGEPVLKGVYIDEVFIRSGSITRVKIGDAAIDDAKVANLSAAKLTVGDGTVGGDLKSTVFVSGSSGWRIRPNGTAEFSGVVVRGTVYATAGTIGNITIGGSAIQSSNFVAGTSGFRIHSDGSVEFNNAFIRGQLSGVTGTFNGTLSVGTTPAISGTTMTGSGAVFNAGGPWAAGNGTTNITFNGTVLTLNGAIVKKENLALDEFTVSFNGGNQNYSQPSVPFTHVFASRTATPSGGTPPYTYSWVFSMTNADGSQGTNEIIMTGNSSSSTIGCTATVRFGEIGGVATCTVRDANGRVAVNSVGFLAIQAI